MKTKLQEHLKTAPSFSVTPGRTCFLQRKCACGGTPGLDGECTACRAKRLAMQTQAAPAAPSALPPARQQPASEPGRGHDFRQMNVYAARHQSRSPATTTLFETEEGTETIAARPRATRTADADGGAPASDGGTRPDGGGSSSSCAVTGSFVTIPSGTLPATLTGSRLGAAFNMIGSFNFNVAPCTCKCGEYRQFVRGTFTRNGSPVPHPLCGTTIDATNFQEDCARVGGTDFKYGYRSIQFATSNFTPDQIRGCRYEGLDAPAILGSSGDALAINLDFRGRLIDTCNGTTLATADWSVSGSATVP